ncbi:MAG: HAMP domain-containing histidine kinase [Chloracidobacterium sp.]|nr:HAMP domain-containing histidine kinase [Chloracidobacterium sp.]
MYNDKLCSTDNIAATIQSCKEVSQKWPREEIFVDRLLVADFAHQVRTPLFNISSTLDIIELFIEDGAECQQYLATVKREINRLSDLMRDILEYSKPHTRCQSEDAVENVIAQAILSCSPLAERMNVKIVADSEKKVSPILTDRSRLVQAFINLLENAIQHSPAGGIVAVETSEVRIGAQIWIECAVSDNGRGFCPEDLPNVFAPFYTRHRGGTGLGLSIAQRIVEQHGGKIWAGNKTGSGAIVKLRLLKNSWTSDQNNVHNESGRHINLHATHIL